MSVLSLTNVSFGFSASGRSAPLDVLHDINLSVEKDEIISVIGPSGSGKSTLLRLCAGILRPTAGAIAYATDDNQGTWVPMVEQTPALLPWRDTIGNIALYGEILGRIDAYQEAARFCKKVGLSGFETYRPSELSGGMQTRAAVARALTVAERLILLDEPFSNLDEITRFGILEDFAKEVKSRSLSAIVVSHNIEEAIYIGDRVAILADSPASFVEIVTPVLQKKDVQSTLANREFIDVVTRVRALVTDRWERKNA